MGKTASDMLHPRGSVAGRVFSRIDVAMHIAASLPVVDRHELLGARVLV